MTIPSVEHLRRAFAPGAFRPAEYTVDPVEHALLSIAMRSSGGTPFLGASRGEQAAHPLIPFIASMRAMGMPLQEVFERAQAEDDAPPLHGSVSTRWEAPIVIGRTYVTQTQLVDARRRASTSLGTMDILTLKTDLRGEDGVVSASVNNVLIIPRTEGGTA